jgi:large subunit ribosomal protein L1
MAKLSKKRKINIEKVERNKKYPLAEAIKLLKETSKVKFDSSVEIHVRLGIDPKKSDQSIRGMVVLPHGSGKKLKIAAFVTPAKEKEAKEAGAEVIGNKELIEKIKTSGKCDFDIAVAEPTLMKDLAVIARILGQKGLMPNPKSGTVTLEIKKTIEELKKGKVSFKNDDTGNVHIMVGKVSFEDNKLKENIEVFLEALKKLRPESTKGVFIQSVVLSTTMGPGIRI